MDSKFPRSERLHRQSEIDACYRKGARAAGKFLRVHVRPNGLEFSRLAISVPRRLCGAVQRNRWKRLIRESFRLNKEAIGPGLDIVAVPTRPPGGVKRPEVEAVLVQILRRKRA